MKFESIDYERRKKIIEEHVLLANHSKIHQSQFTVQDIILPNQYVMHFCEINIDKLPKPKLLLLHGFGGSNFFFYKLYPHLSQFYHIISVDLPGMGFNSRPAIPFGNFENCADFFVSHLKLFFETIGWRKFSLLGFSMGGYIASLFFDRFSESIERLFLVSPGGFNLAHQDSKREFLERNKGLSWMGEGMKDWAFDQIMKRKKSPFELGWRWLREGLLLRMVVHRFFGSNRFQSNLTVDEIVRLKKLTRYLVSLPQSGERALGYFFHYGPDSERPIIEILERHKQRSKDVYVIFGDEDWTNDSKTANNLKERKLDVQLFEIMDSDHNVPFHNPLDLSKIIIDAQMKGASSQRTLHSYFR